MKYALYGLTLIVCTIFTLFVINWSFNNLKVFARTKKAILYRSKLQDSLDQLTHYQDSNTINIRLQLQQNIDSIDKYILNRKTKE